MPVRPGRRHVPDVRLMGIAVVGLVLACLVMSGVVVGLGLARPSRAAPAAPWPAIRRPRPAADQSRPGPPRRGPAEQRPDSPGLAPAPAPARPALMSSATS